MSNAAIYFHPDAFDTSRPNLMGRQAAGESFLRGFAAHADLDQFYFCNASSKSHADAEALLRRIAPISKAVNWIGGREIARLRPIGCLFAPHPSNTADAWRRHPLGSRAYSICGLTHTISSAGVMDTLAEMLTAPVEPWDALICTSTAAKVAIETELDACYAQLQARLGATIRPAIRLETIPLGVNVTDFVSKPGGRQEWRARFRIDEDDFAALYVGRFSFHAKMNPVPMALALERVARQSQRRIHWLLYGQAHNAEIDAVFKQAIRVAAPGVILHFLDGRDSGLREALWSAADAFLSLSDNIQETFGLTPLEAMAAGLPVVVSDWDGYRDTVRHQIDGFRIRTTTPRAGLAEDLAFRYAEGWDTYDQYIGVTSLLTAVDIGEAAEALLALVENPETRRSMGAAAAERARNEYDWRVVIPQYQALWADLAALRARAPSSTLPGANPRRLDPFRLFASFPTDQMNPESVISATPFASPEAALELVRSSLVQYAAAKLARPAQAARMLDLLVEQGPMSVMQLVAAFSPEAQGLIERSVLLLAKYGLVHISPKPYAIA